MPPLAAAPSEPVELPDAVRAHAPSARAIWRNELGGLTFRADDRFLKWNPAGSPLELGAERARLAWAAPFHPVPEVLAFEQHPDGELLITRALPGAGAVSARWIARPREAVRAIGEGLRALHEDLPVAECPFDWSAERRLRAKIGVPLGEIPEIDALVVCHGDACAPNTIIDGDGRWSGHVDLGALGVADRWADLAVASMSLAWNYGEGFEDDFFAAYGIAPDAERIRFYRMLWDAEDARG